MAADLNDLLAAAETAGSNRIRVSYRIKAVRLLATEIEKLRKELAFHRTQSGHNNRETSAKAEGERDERKTTLNRKEGE